MSENDTALEVNEDEVDVMSLLADESVESDIDEEIDSAVPETIEELKEALIREREIKTKRNHSLKKSKQATHRIQEENEALLKRLDSMDQRITSSQPNQEAEKLEQEAQEWRDRVEENPADAIGYTDWKQRQFEDKVATYIGREFEDIKSMIGGIQQAADPEVIKYQTQISALRQKEGFSELDDATLLVVAKGLSGAKVKSPRGSVSGGKPFTIKNGKSEPTAELLKKMGFPPRG